MFKGLLDGLKALVLGGQDEDWDYGERRKLIRLQCHYDVEGRVDRKKIEGKIVDMGLKGMKFRTFAQLKKGDTVEITYPVPILEVQNQTVRCEVLWVRKRDRDFVLFAGLLYSEDDRVMGESWIKYLLKQLGFSKDLIHQKRKSVRADCFVPADVVYAAGKALKGRLYNLGVGGALVEVPGGLEKGTAVELRIGPFEDLPRFAINGVVATGRQEARNHLHGVEFQNVTDGQVVRLGQYLFFLLRNQWCE